MGIIALREVRTHRHVTVVPMLQQGGYQVRSALALAILATIAQDEKARPRLLASSALLARTLMSMHITARAPALGATEIVDQGIIAPETVRTRESVVR